MVSFCIDRVILGTAEHFISIDGRYGWSKNIPARAWHLSGRLKRLGLCMDTLFKLNAINQRIMPPDAFSNAMRLCTVNSPDHAIPWRDIMPKAAHRTFMRDIISRVEESLSSASCDYYEGAWASGSAVLNYLMQAHVDVGQWQALTDARGGNWHVAQTFNPNSDGRCPPISYNRFGTRTGRLTVASGPGILTLKRDSRHILRSRHGNEGVIAYLDFSNLEARILLYENGGRCDDSDLYNYINQELFAGAMKRDDIKIAVISELYGQGKQALGKRLNLHGKHLDQFVNRIRRYFKTDRLLKRVKAEFIKSGHITNHYGRRVEVDEPLDHIFINSYTQSTGVDVTMLGFERVIERTSEFRLEPIFLLHDAMLLDCHRDDFHHLEAIKHVTVPGYVQKYPLSLETLDVHPTQEM